MGDETNTQRRRGEQVCSWCDTAFKPVALLKRPVCPHCYRLLISAGVSDKVIFGEEESDKDSGAGDSRNGLKARD